MRIIRIPKQTGLAGLWQTMYVMRDLVRKSINDRFIKDTAVKIIRDIPPQDELKQIEKIFNYVRDNIKYVKDIYGVEEIQTPSRMIKNIEQKKAFGDCDDMALTLASLLHNTGFKTRFVVIATTPKMYNHIRTEVFYKGQWIPLEATSKKPMGYKMFSYEEPLILEI
jgi:transglutaminase-like putative cysteine protease